MVMMCSHGDLLTGLGTAGAKLPDPRGLFRVKLEVQHLSTPGDVSIAADVSISLPSLEQVTRPGAHPSHPSPPLAPVSCSEDFPTTAGGRPHPQLLLRGGIQHGSGIAGDSEGSQSHLWGGQRKYNPDVGQDPDLLSPLTSLIILQPDPADHLDVGTEHLRVLRSKKRPKREELN